VTGNGKAGTKSHKAGRPDEAAVKGRMWHNNLVIASIALITAIASGVDHFRPSPLCHACPPPTMAHGAARPEFSGHGAGLYRNAKRLVNTRQY
jgi:hypothetical protein